jgi:hypothetical protein
LDWSTRWSIDAHARPARERSCCTISAPDVYHTEFICFTTLCRVFWILSCISCDGSPSQLKNHHSLEPSQFRCPMLHNVTSRALYPRASMSVVNVRVAQAAQVADLPDLNLVAFTVVVVVVYAVAVPVAILSYRVGHNGHSVSVPWVVECMQRKPQATIPTPLESYDGWLGTPRGMLSI